MSKLNRPSDTYNPLDQIGVDSPLLIDDCRSIAEALVLRSGNESEPHWNDSAEAWISAMAAVACLYGEAGDRSLQTIRTLLTSPTKMAAVIKIMCESKDCGGMLARMGNQLTYYKDKELSSVLTTTNRHLRFLDTLSVAKNTSSSSFDPNDLRMGKMTIYLVLPLEHAKTQSPLLRVWLGSMLHTVLRGGVQNDSKVHFLVDEASTVGHLESIETALNVGRGFGVRLHLIHQSLGQLKKCWPDGQDQTLLSNTTQIFFGTNDMASAEYVSNRLGEYTAVVDSGGTSDGDSLQTNNNDGNVSRTSSRNNNKNWAQQARKLLKPEEVIAMNPRTAITFVPGVPPVMTWLTRYYEQGNAGKARWKRLKWLAEVWVAALGLLLLAVLAAVVMTRMTMTR
jgi:type IV secretion system protein VirD4